MNAREAIMTSVLGCRRSELYGDRRTISMIEQQQCDEMMDRLGRGEPLQYIIQETEFFGLRFFVDSRVLIPRPETEIMADTLIKKFSPCASCGGQVHILDIGTGSGCLAVSLAKAFPSAHVDAVDISRDALDVAQHNAAMHSVEKRITFYCDDIFRMWPRLLFQPYDLIVSNPPYIPTGKLKALPIDVLHEPRIAFDGGSDGLMFYREIIRETPVRLKTGGLLACEFWDGQEHDLNGMLDDEMWSVQFFNDLSGTDRFFIAGKKI